MKNSLLILSFLSLDLYLFGSEFIKDGKLVQGVTINDAQMALNQIVDPFREKIDSNLVMQAGKPKVLHNKNTITDIDHVVNLRPEIKADRTVSLEGGHMYKVLNNFNSQGLIVNSIVVKDQATNCCAFSGIDQVTGNSLYKTTFPQGWTPEDIHKAIISSSIISEEKSGNKLVVRAEVPSIRKNSKFTIKIVSHAIDKSNIYQMITAYPEVNH